MGHKLVSGAQVSLVLQSRHAFSSSGLCYVPLKYLVGSGQEPNGQSVQASQKQDSLLKEGRYCPQLSSVLSSCHLQCFELGLLWQISYLCYQQDLPISGSPGPIIGLGPEQKFFKTCLADGIELPKSSSTFLRGVASSPSFFKQAYTRDPVGGSNKSREGQKSLNLGFFTHELCALWQVSDPFIAS